MPEASQFQTTFVDIEVTIPQDAATPASGVQTYGLTPIGLLFPAAMTGDTLTFTTNNGSGTYKVVNGLSLSITVDNLVCFSSAWDAVKLGDDWKPVSNGSEAAARTVIVRCRAV